MPSNFFSSDGRDLDSVFELKSQFPNLPVSSTSSMYFAGLQDFASRYIVSLPGNINTGFYVSWPATPYKAAWTEQINEGGEIIYIYHPAEPYVPAGSRDIGTIFTPKGKIANYYNYPRNFVPAPSDNNYSLSVSRPDNTSGNLSASWLFNCRVIGQVINDSDPITQLVIVSSSLVSGNMYQAVTVSAVTKIAAQKWQATITVGLSTTTSYSFGSGSSQASLRLQFYTITASGVRSDAAISPYMAPPYTSTQYILFINLNHTVNPIYTGN